MQVSTGEGRASAQLHLHVHTSNQRPEDKKCLDCSSTYRAEAKQDHSVPGTKHSPVPQGEQGQSCSPHIPPGETHKNQKMMPKILGKPAKHQAPVPGLPTRIPLPAEVDTQCPAWLHSGVPTQLTVLKVQVRSSEHPRQKSTKPTLPAKLSCNFCSGQLLCSTAILEMFVLFLHVLLPGGECQQKENRNLSETSDPAFRNVISNFKFNLQSKQRPNGHSQLSGSAPEPFPNPTEEADCTLPNPALLLVLIFTSGRYN